MEISSEIIELFAEYATKFKCEVILTIDNRGSGSVVMRTHPQKHWDIWPWDDEHHSFATREGLSEVLEQIAEGLEESRE